MAEDAAVGAAEVAPAAAGKAKESKGAAAHRRQIIKTWTVFVALIVVQLALLEVSSKPGWGFDFWFSSRTAEVTTALLHLFGEDSAVLSRGVLINSDRFDMKVIFECTGLLNIFILVAAVMAFPSTWMAKVIGIAGGTVLLLVVNQVRLLSLVYLGGEMDIATFENFHVIFWQSLMIFITLGVWLLWASRFVKPTKAAAPGATAA